MLTPSQVQMFTRLGRGEPQLCQWLRAELDRAHEVLARMADETQLRVAQGRAQMLLEMLGHLQKFGAAGPV